jgi:hypothetical protein
METIHDKDREQQAIVYHQPGYICDQKSQLKISLFLLTVILMHQKQIEHIKQAIHISLHSFDLNHP